MERPPRYQPRVLRDSYFDDGYFDTDSETDKEDDGGLRGLAFIYS